MPRKHEINPSNQGQVISALRDKKIQRGIANGVFLVTQEVATIAGYTSAQVMPNTKFSKAAQTLDGHDIYIYDNPGRKEIWFTELKHLPQINTV